MKNIRCFLIIATVFGVLASCTNSRNSDEEKFFNTYNTNDSSLYNNYLTVYTIPSPLQVSTILKLLDIKYTENLISDTKLSNTFYPTRYSKALNLGIITIDFGYVTMYEQYQASLVYLNKIEKLLSELEVDNPKAMLAAESFRKNIQNQDSLYQIILGYQSDLEEYFVNAQDQETGLLIISGIYIEGLYISTKIHNQQLKNKTITRYMQKPLNMMALQQQQFLRNLIELLEMHCGNKYEELISNLHRLDKEFEEMQITYNYDEKNKKLDKVKLRNDKIEKINAIVGSMRNRIINNL